ncbi:MAG TPA: POTRA domain-containing protein, partial [Variovorax sp.]|nr:POTRA domain-containing protein [Variovorax sp.]
TPAAEPPAKATPLPRIEGKPADDRPLSVLPDNLPNVAVRGLTFTGNDVYTQAQLHPLVQDAEGRELTIAQLDEVATRITRLYRNAGYFVARAYVPAQEIVDGQVRIRVIEGHHGDFHLDHRGRLKQATAQAILETARERDIVSLDTLERAMLVLNDTPGVHVSQVSVSPGAQVGTSDFNVATEPTPEFAGAASFDNHGSVYTGRNRLSLAGAWDGVSRNGDRLDVAALTSTGGEGLASGRLGYGRLLTPGGLRGELALSRTTYSLGSIYSSLDAVGHANSVSGQLTYPLVLTGTHRLTASWGGAYTELVDEVRSTGVRLPKSVAAVTGGLEYAGIGAATATQAGALLTIGSLDIRDANARANDAAGAASHGTFSKLGLHAEHRRMLPHEVQLDLRLRAQATLSGKSLDGSQKMAVSGADGVAAYAPGELLGDSGAVVRFALSRSFRLNDAVSIAPSIFLDEGRARNRHAMAGIARERSLGDAGLGLAARYRTATLSLQWITRTHGGDAVSEPVSKHRVLGQLSVGF